MVLASHVIFSAYGFWLPNDPRGSWSTFVGSLELFRFGPATKVTTRRSVAHQPHDHVLREEERKRNAFSSFCFYTLANPVRAGLVKSEADWPFTGAILPGYPTLHPLAEDYWEKFWKLYVAAREAEPPPAP